MPCLVVVVRCASGAGRGGHDRVVGRGGSSCVDPREAEQQTGREIHDAREFVLTRTGAARDQPERDAERDERLGGTEVEARAPAAKASAASPRRRSPSAEIDSSVSIEAVSIVPSALRVGWLVR